MKKFEIIIKNLETGETLNKEKTNCIIGAYSKNDSVQCFCASNAPVLEIIQTINGVEREIKEIKHQIGLNNPILDLLTKLMTKEEDDDE